MMQIDRISQTQAPMRRPQAARYLSSTALATLIALGAAGAVSSQQWTGAVNTDYGTAGNWNPAVVPGAGDSAVIDAFSDVDVNGDFALDALQQDTGTMTITGGNSLTLTTGPGTALFRLESALQIDAGGTLTANEFTARNRAVVNVDGTLAAPMVTIDRGVVFNVNNGGTLDGDFLMQGVTPLVTIADGGTVTGNATVERGTLINNGDIDGNLNTTGGNVAVNVSIGATGTVGGDVVHSGGTITNNGTITGELSTVQQGVVATVTNGATVGSVQSNNGTVNLDAGSTVNGTVTTSDNAQVNAAGTIIGTTTLNGGTFNSMGATLGNLTNNAGTLDVDTGNLTVGGTFTNSGQVRISDGRSIAFGTMTNSGGISLLNGTPGSIDATLTGSVVGGGGGGAINMQNGAAGDSLTIQGAGGLSGTNTLAIDIDLTTTNAGFADTLFVDNQVDGPLQIDINAITTGGLFTLQQSPITLVDGGSFGGALDEMRTGDLAQGTTGIIIYSLVRDPGTSDIQLQSEINPAIGGVAAAFSSVQSLVGSVVNRPSGAYVSGIAFDTPNNCSTGVWGRVLGGRVDSRSDTRNVLGTTINSSGDLDYAGFQGGADFGCFEAFDGGWDISGGALVGMNFGEFTERAAGLITAGDFDQYFLGGYVAAARGNWSGEMQVRYETADFTFDNPSLDVRNADTSVDSYSISGSVTYRHELQPGLAVLPSAGFSVTESDSASLTLTNPMGTPVGTLTVGSHTNVTTFLGATLSKTTVNEAAGQATNAFLTGTYYFDGSGSRDSTFRTFDGLATTSLSTSEVGDFGEISAGGSIVRIIGKGPGGVRQVNYSVRVDARYGDDLDGVGVTGQIRYQF
jgi:hypothetical protein